MELTLKMNKIIEIKFGSHLYGTNTETSDLDLKAIYLPTAQDIVLGRVKKTISTTRPKGFKERNNKDDVDIEIFSLDRFLQLLAEGQLVAIDMLFAPKEFQTFRSEDAWIFDHIYKNRFEILNKDLSAIVGYAAHQAAKYGLKGHRVHAVQTSIKHFEWLDGGEMKMKDAWSEFVKWSESTGNENIKISKYTDPVKGEEQYLEINSKKYSFHMRCKDVLEKLSRAQDEYGKRALQAADNQNLDWKALSHAVRVNGEGIELFKTGEITFPRPDRELLLKIKKGEMDYKEVAEMIEFGLEEIKIVQKTSMLRQEANKTWIDNFTFGIYRDIIKGTL